MPQLAPTRLFPVQALVATAFMQYEGLMELVVLTMLRDAAIISTATFSALVLMALATTAATKPLALLALRRAGTP